MRRIDSLIIAVFVAVLGLTLADAGPAAADRAPPMERSFSTQVVDLFRVVNCGSSAALPTRLGKEEKRIAKHCKELTESMATYRQKWLDKAMPFFKGLVPAGLPDRVVYPYAGGDLVTALAVFPDATELTGISLESAGDPRGIDRLVGDDLGKALDVNRHNVMRLMTAAFSATTELAAGESTELPGQLIVALSGLAVHGYEPVSLRYFTIDADGSLRYVTDEDIAAHDKAFKKKGKKGERELRVSIFSNAELTFRKAGDAKAPLKTYRHIAANLYDDAFTADGPLMKHLVGKGPIAAMTKAASHLLWNAKSSHMRDYLLGNMVWMISDATGIPPDAAIKAGFELQTWGKYAGAYFEHRVPTVEKAMIDLWARNPQKALDFRFGYFDKKFQNHLLVAKKKR